MYDISSDYLKINNYNVHWVTDMSTVKRGLLYQDSKYKQHDIGMCPVKRNISVKAGTHPTV